LPFDKRRRRYAPLVFYRVIGGKNRLLATLSVVDFAFYGNKFHKMILVCDAKSKKIFHAFALIIFTTNVEIS